MLADIENAVLLRHGAQASVRVLTLKQPVWTERGYGELVPWYWLAMRLPGQSEQLLGRRRTTDELLALVEKPRYQRSTRPVGTR